MIKVTNLEKWRSPSSVQIQIKCRNSLSQETWPSPKLIWAYKLKWTYQLDHGFVDSIVHANLINPKVVQMSKFDHDQNWFVCVHWIDSIYYFIVCIDSTKFGTCTTKLSLLVNCTESIEHTNLNVDDIFVLYFEKQFASTSQEK